MQLNTCEILCCPGCRRALDPVGATRGFIDEGALRCSSCEREYPIHCGIPIFLGDLLSVKAAEKDFAALDEHSKQKVLQREWHDRENFDRSYKRADYASRTFFSYLLYYQMREMERLLSQARYSRVANICAGHGFELEFLSRFCRDIVAVDISWNSLRVALNRACELGLNVEAVCADAENLPLRDGTFDLVFTHHSLHHLPRPVRGLEEMIRVTSHGIAVCEPVKGFARTVLTRSGVKAQFEESGNFVYELDPRDVEILCTNQHLRLRYFQKCLITGPADEPAWFRRLDSWHITPVLCGAISLGNRILGNLLGTKCSLLLERDGDVAGSPFSPELCSGAMHGTEA